MLFYIDLQILNNESRDSQDRDSELQDQDKEQEQEQDFENKVLRRLESKSQVSRTELQALLGSIDKSISDSACCNRCYREWSVLYASIFVCHTRAPR